MPQAALPVIVAMLLVALLVVMTSLGVAVRADALARRSPQARARASGEAGSEALPRDLGGPEWSWRRVATWAWFICAGASVLALGVVCGLVCFG
ncbi:hypothetical protein ACFWAY_32130 [Rhodococcus sp. NPDC059968]|uniref:hypothetical protein n=1 Tax=Rhodococcus sp. NPDC059968 TaxID=3347017 RepID=UPI0036728BB4